MKQIIIIVILTIILVGCADQPTAAEEAAKYTDEVAKAIIEGSWKIAGQSRRACGAVGVS